MVFNHVLITRTQPSGLLDQLFPLLLKDGNKLLIKIQYNNPNLSSMTYIISHFLFFIFKKK